jgi:hypothetical protein
VPGNNCTGDLDLVAKGKIRSSRKSNCGHPAYSQSLCYVSYFVLLNLLCTDETSEYSKIANTSSGNQNFSAFAVTQGKYGVTRVEWLWVFSGWNF